MRCQFGPADILLRVCHLLHPDHLITILPGEQLADSSAMVAGTVVWVVKIARGPYLQDWVHRVALWGVAGCLRGWSWELWLRLYPERKLWEPSLPVPVCCLADKLRASL